MSYLPKRWKVMEKAPSSFFEKFPDLPRLIVQILFNRDIVEPEEVRAFMEKSWPHDNPFHVKDMDDAVTRLRRALDNGERIAIYGDYDADGVTATALLVQTLRALGGNVIPYIPNRFEEGYGLNCDALTELAGQDVQVVVTVDCGIRSIQEVEHGKSLGLDLIVTDHHHVLDRIPPCTAAINPKREDCRYPYKDLAGVGVAYKLAQALLRARACSDGRRVELSEEDLLDLVALGTVADLVPLTGENRYLVQKGLESLNNPTRPGIVALLQNAGVRPGEVTAGTIGFTLGPRLNAAGRLESALAAYELLVTQDADEANRIALKLEETNRQRQELTQVAVERARQVILDDEGRKPLYLIADEGFMSGVVGLVASRLTEEFYRPTLVIECGPEVSKGSARSIEEFHITDALDVCAELMIRHGGHAAAAGFTIKNENLPVLGERLLEIAEEQLEVETLRPTVRIDAEVNLRGLPRRRIEQNLYARMHNRPYDEKDEGLQLIDRMEALQPCGYGNPSPRFMSRDLKVEAKRKVGHEGRHLKLVLSDGKQNWDCIAFRQGEWASDLPDRVDVVYSFEINQWNDNVRLQLNVKDIKPSV